MATKDDQFEKCVFCEIVKGQGVADLVVYQDKMTAVFPSLHQRANNRGHMLVVPLPHVSSIYVLDTEVGTALMHTICRVTNAVKMAFSADGIAIKQHNDKHGGQDVFHVHFHVFPCFDGDGFFRGEDRWPVGLHELQLEERIAQAKLVRKALTKL